MTNKIYKLNDLHPILLDIISQAYSSKTVPLEWLVSVVIPVYKKGVSVLCVFVQNCVIDFF